MLVGIANKEDPGQTCKIAEYARSSMIILLHGSILKSLYPAMLEKSTCPLSMTSTTCCRTSRNFDSFQCKLLNLATHMGM